MVQKRGGYGIWIYSWRHIDYCTVHCCDVYQTERHFIAVPAVLVLRLPSLVYPQPLQVYNGLACLHSQ